MEALKFKLGLAVLASMFLAKLNNITPEYLLGAMQNAHTEFLRNVAEFFYAVATNPFTSFLFNTPHLEILPEDTYGFTSVFMLINFLLTYTPVFFLLFLFVPKVFARRTNKIIEDNREFPNYYNPEEEEDKSFLSRLKLFAQGVKVSFRIAFLED